MTEFVVEGSPARGLQGRLAVPGDKSISHRAILLAALADGRSELRGISGGLDVGHTLAAVTAFGADVSQGPDGTVTVTGGRDRLHEPDGVIDVGNSGTTIRLLAGWSAGLSGLAVLAGDASIARRPMDRVAEPLRAMGALVDGRQRGRLPPLVIRGGDLQGIDYSLPVASAQVKGAVLLAGLGADGETIVRDPVPVRRHTEELLAAFGADVFAVRNAVMVRRSSLTPVRLAVPGDPSQAAFWVVAACLTPGSDLVVEQVYVGPGRAGFVGVLMRMGADLAVEGYDDATHTGDLHARYGPLRATDVGGVEVPGLIDEIPILAVAAAVADGTTTFADAQELVVKESDRVATVAAGLRALGVDVEPRADGLVVHGNGGRPLTGGTVDAHGDHRVAMALAVAGLVATGPTSVAGWEAVATSYPTFEEDLRRCVS